MVAAMDRVAPPIH